MTSKQLMLPAHRAFDSDGAPEAGATAHLYLSGTLTPALFYDDSALTVSIGSVITANAAGRFNPMPYQDASIAFRIIIEDSEGTVLDDIDPFYFGLVPGVDGIHIPVKTRPELSAISVLVAKDSRYLSESGREGVFVFDPSNLSASVTSDPAQGLYVAPSSDITGASGAWVRKYEGAASPMWFGAVGDGATDDTTAVQRTITSCPIVSFPGNTFIISAITIPANRKLSFDKDTLIKQKSGTPTATRIISINGSNVTIGDCAIEGQLNQAGDTTGEQNHGIFIYINNTDTVSRSNINLGDIKGTNIRGDVVTTGVHPAAYTAGYRLTGITIGKIVGSNVYRNVVSITGGSDISIASIAGTQVGLYVLDVEQDVGSGPITGLRVGAIKGRYIGLVGPTAADYISGVEIDYLDIDPSYTTTSSPAYGTTLTDGFAFRNLKQGHVEKAYIKGFNGPGVKQTYNSGEITKQTLSFGELEISGCCVTDAVNYGYITGASPVSLIRIETLKVTTIDTKAALLNCDFATIQSCEATNPSTAGLLRSCANASIRNLNHTGAGTPFVACDNLVAVGGKVAATALALCSFSTSPVFMGYTSTHTTLFNTVTNGSIYSSSLNGSYYHTFSPVHSLDTSGNLSVSGVFASSNVSGINTGDGAYSVQNKILGYTATETSGDIVVKCDLAAGFTVVLPTAVGNKARFTFKKMQTAGIITIDGAGTETIDGGLTAALNNQYESITIVSDNQNWNII